MFLLYHILGIAVAGETISTSAEGDMARALESIINPATNTDDNGTRGNIQLDFLFFVK